MIGLTLAGLIAGLHLWILVLEMFRWEHPRTRAIFGTDADFARRSRVMAANQGLYNGFLGAGLIWGICRHDRDTVLFFLMCVAVAGIFGGLTASRRILFVQAAPAILAALLVRFGI